MADTGSAGRETGEPDGRPRPARRGPPSGRAPRPAPVRGRAPSDAGANSAAGAGVTRGRLRLPDRVAAPPRGALSANGEHLEFPGAPGSAEMIPRNPNGAWPGETGGEGAGTGGASLVHLACRTVVIRKKTRF